MGNRSSLLLRKEEIAQIRNETGCKYQVERYNYDFTALNMHVLFKLYVFLDLRRNRLKF